MPTAASSALQLHCTRATVVELHVWCGRTRFAEPCTQIVAVHLSWQVITQRRLDASSPCKIQEVVRLVSIERHLADGDVERIGIITRRIGNAGSELFARIDERNL